MCRPLASAQTGESARQAQTRNPLIGPESKAWLEARLKTPESQRCFDELVSIIVEWAVAQMPVNMLQVLIGEKRQPTIKSPWSDISSPVPRKA